MRAGDPVRVRAGVRTGEILECAQARFQECAQARRRSARKNVLNDTRRGLEFPEFESGTTMVPLWHEPAMQTPPTLVRAPGANGPAI